MIRRARPDDAHLLARIHVASWRTTYAGIVDPDVLAGLSVAYRERQWAEWLADPQRSAFVAERDDSPVGFAIGGAARDAHLGIDGELYALYLLQEVQRMGFGGQLMRAMFDALRQRDMTSAYTWVFTDNMPGRAFYRSMGGQEGPVQSFCIGPRTHHEIAYLWPELDIAIC